MAIGFEESGLNLPSTSLEYYLALLGFKGKRLPKICEMPAKIFLPSEITKILWQTLSATNETGNEEGVDLRVVNCSIKPSRYSKGDNKSVKLPFSWFGKRLADIHAHPINSPGFSDEDMAIFYSDPRSAGYLFISISNGGISALARTQETSALPLSSTLKKVKEVQYLRKRVKSGTSLTERGYVCYEWENPSRTFHPQGEDGSGFNMVNPLDRSQIINGIELVRKEI